MLNQHLINRFWGNFFYRNKLSINFNTTQNIKCNTELSELLLKYPFTVLFYLFRIELHTSYHSKKWIGFRFSSLLIVSQSLIDPSMSTISLIVLIPLLTRDNSDFNKLIVP